MAISPLARLHIIMESRHVGRTGSLVARLAADERNGRDELKQAAAFGRISSLGS
jgi:hypothetical protein